MFGLGRGSEPEEVYAERQGVPSIRVLSGRAFPGHFFAALFAHEQPDVFASGCLSVLVNQSAMVWFTHPQPLHTVSLVAVLRGALPGLRRAVGWFEPWGCLPPPSPFLSSRFLSSRWLLRGVSNHWAASEMVLRAFSTILCQRMVSSSNDLTPLSCSGAAALDFTED